MTTIEIGAQAAEFVKDLAFKSKLTRNGTFHELTWDNIRLERVVGVGGYSRVYKAYIQNHAELGTDSSFAIKCLNKGTMEDDDIFKIGAIDLAAEGEVLSRLHHENIIQIHGHSAGGPLHAFSESEKGYFLALDMLKDTLQNKLKMDRIKLQRRRIGGLSGAHAGVAERLQKIALGVAKGVAYLHSQGIVLRDLKPENVGFDGNGIPKLFDFGFAREVHTINDLEVCGNLRYMAPEIMLGNGTTLASDVYSFGVLLWELCTLQKPYKCFPSTTEFQKKVFHEGRRPDLKPIRSSALRNLIGSCWDPNPDKRPSMDHVIKVLRVEIAVSGALPKKGASSALTSARSLEKGLQRVNSLTSMSSKTFHKINSWTSKKLSASNLSDSNISILVPSKTKNAECTLNATRTNPILDLSGMVTDLSIPADAGDYSIGEDDEAGGSIYIETASKGGATCSTATMVDDREESLAQSETQNLMVKKILSFEEICHSSSPVLICSKEMLHLPTILHEDK